MILILSAELAALSVLLQNVSPKMAIARNVNVSECTHRNNLRYNIFFMATSYARSVISSLFDGDIWLIFVSWHRDLKSRYSTFRIRMALEDSFPILDSALALGIRFRNKI